MKTYKEYANYQDLPVDVPGLSKEMAADLEARITEFEEKHQDDVLNGKDGFVPKLKKKDWIIAITVNGLIAMYYIIALVSQTGTPKEVT